MKPILKDINGKPIYENQKFKFQFLRDLHKPAIELIGSFDWLEEELRYEIDIWNNEEYVCLSYVPAVMTNFELIEEQPKEPLPKEWLDKELKELEEYFEGKKTYIFRAYCESNNPHKKGDIIKDDQGSIQIESISFTRKNFFTGEPCCVYDGVELTKKLVPNKLGRKRSIYQPDIIEL